MRTRTRYKSGLLEKGRDRRVPPFFLVWREKGTTMMTRPTTAKATPQLAKASHGFSLIELLVVIAIIMIIAAIAVPNFLRSRMAANEAAAAETVRSITTAAVVYST